MTIEKLGAEYKSYWVTKEPLWEEDRMGPVKQSGDTVLFRKLGAGKPCAGPEGRPGFPQQKSLRNRIYGVQGY